MDKSSSNRVTHGHTYTLYTYFRSSCSARVRIAAHYKSLPLQYKYVHLLQNEQHAEEYKSVNPSESVPTLVVTETATGEHVVTIRQSVAILEYLEEARPDLPVLLPPSNHPELRSTVRELVNVIACDVQPVTNLRILQYVRPFGADAAEWARHFMAAGLMAYEILALQSAGKYSVGDEVTMADLCLLPAVDNAQRFGVDMSVLPTIQRISGNLRSHPAFQRGSWQTQEDTPPELRLSVGPQ